MKISYIWSLLLLSGISLPAEQAIWQLGKPDGSASEFKIPYRPWEYGNAPAISSSSAVDHRTYTFNYDIAANREISNPELVSSLATVREQAWMQKDEMVTGVKLVWNETDGGNRKLVFNTINWENQHGGKDGIEVMLPNGGKKIFALPAGKAKKQDILKFETVFPVKAGKNELTIRIASPAKHYRFDFDSIALEKTDAKPVLPPVIESAFDAPDNIYHPGQPVALRFKAFNLPDGKGNLTYTVTDAFGKKVTTGNAVLNNSTGKVMLPSAERGYFKVDFRLDREPGQSSYVVIEPVTPEYVDDSRFGCHALNGDGYRLRYWPERQELKMRRAFQAGAKWARYHRLSWDVVEPAKGKYDWEFVDRKLALAEKYKLRVLLNVGDTPEWASSSTDKKLTVCGNYRYTQYPPKNWQDWADFITVVVNRYQGQVKWYELWNEPGYSSAFWCNGSASDFAKLLKVGYEAAKKADPNCVILSGAPLDPPAFFEEVLRNNGNKRYFDVMSIHYPGNDKRGGERVRRWREVMDKTGKDVPLVNSEESKWTSSDESLDFASTLLKIYVREAALGISKTFGFELFDDNTSRKYSTFDIRDNPLPQYAAFRTMTHRLEHAKFVADLSTAECETYLFERQGTAILVFWSDKGREIALNLGAAGATLVNLMDVETPLRATDNIFKVRATSAPAFLIGGDLAMLTALGKVLKALPEEIILKPGETARRSLNLDPGATGLTLNLPAGWTGKIDRKETVLTAPKNTPEGVYDARISVVISGRACTIPFLIDVVSGVTGANLIRNGDFRNGMQFWYFPKDKTQWAIVKNSDGSQGVKTIGPVFFGCAGGIKVRPGERYAVICEAEGSGSFGGVCTLLDHQGKTVYPKKPGINILSGKLDKEKKTFTDIISINEPQAVLLKFAALANHDDKAGREAVFHRFAIVRLTDKLTVNKVACRGVCVKNAPRITVDGELGEWGNIPAMTLSGSSNAIETASAKWSGPDDLSATCRVAMDPEYLYLAFAVKDNAAVPGEIADAWNYDSIQLAIDPTLEGKDRTEIMIARDSSGKPFVFKLTNFWTAELPEGITPRGLLKTAEVAVKPTPDGMNYEVKIPLRELYPLTGENKEFGFSWLVNDNDGQGRKYLQWSSGIGPAKNASLFGLLQCVTK